MKSLISHWKKRGDPCGRHATSSKASNDGELSSSISTSKRLPYRDAPVGRLPVEILLNIFSYNRIGDEDLHLTHVCREWRYIIIETPAFWTDVHVSREASGKLLLLAMQIDRARGLPLSIVWEAHPDPNINLLAITIFRAKAPFSTWRALSLRGHISWEIGCGMGIEDSFENLEYLSLSPVSTSSLHRTLCRTTTSKLRELDLSSLISIAHPVLSMCGEFFGRVSRLVLPSKATSVYPFYLPNLPSNILELEAGKCSPHIFPHLLHLKLTTFTPLESGGVNLRSLTSLTVTTDFVLWVQVLLPSLLYLSCRRIVLLDDSIIQVPKLETLIISTGITCKYPTRKGRLLAPRRLLQLGPRLATEGILELMQSSPYVQQARIYFDEEQCADEAMDHVFGSFTTTMPLPSLFATPEQLCPHLEVLRLEFRWERRYVEFWRVWAFEWVSRRREAGAVPGSIWATWKGDGSYVLLA